MIEYIHIYIYLYIYILYVYNVLRLYAIHSYATVHPVHTSSTTAESECIDVTHLSYNCCLLTAAMATLYAFAGVISVIRFPASDGTSGFFKKNGKKAQERWSVIFHEQRGPFYFSDFFLCVENMLFNWLAEPQGAFTESCTHTTGRRGFEPRRTPSVTQKQIQIWISEHHDHRHVTRTRRRDEFKSDCCRLNPVGLDSVHLQRCQDQLFFVLMDVRRMICVMNYSSLSFSHVAAAVALFYCLCAIKYTIYIYKYIYTYTHMWLH